MRSVNRNTFIQNRMIQRGEIIPDLSDRPKKEIAHMHSYRQHPNPEWARVLYSLWNHNTKESA